MNETAPIIHEHGRIVPREKVENALTFLTNSAKDIGDARARMERASAMVKIEEAFASKASKETSADRRTAEARTSERYLAAIEEDAVAFGAFEKIKALRDAAALVIEVFRTESATARQFKL